MDRYDVTLLAITIRRWDLESQRLNLTTFFVMDDEEKSSQFELSIVQPPEMIEEFIGKVKVASQNMIRKNSDSEEEIDIEMSNETFLRQKLYNYFKRILMELNNPKRKKGQPKMIFTTHMDVYNETQDISFLPHIIQFYVVLNWARKYYEKEDYQKAVDPLKKLVRIKPDFGLGYKWLARSLKKIRKYDDAMFYYEKYAEVDGSLDSKLDLAKSYRKGKVFDKSEEIYQEVLKENPEDMEARIGRAQIKFARNEPDYMEILDDLNREDPDWLRKWLKDEFNFRVYVSRKTPLSPVQASNYLGYDRVFELTQRAFRNEVPSHFNPSRARMSFYKEEIDNWAKVMNRFNCYPEDIKLYPDNISNERLQPQDINDEEKEAREEKPQKGQTKKPAKMSTKVEEILRQIRASRRNGPNAGTSSGGSSRSGNPKQTGAAGETKKRRGRPPKKKSEDTAAAGESAPQKKRGRGRPPKRKTEGDNNSPKSGGTDNGADSQTKKRGRGRPKKVKAAESDNKGTASSES